MFGGSVVLSLGSPLHLIAGHWITQDLGLCPDHPNYSLSLCRHGLVCNLQLMRSLYCWSRFLGSCWSSQLQMLQWPYFQYRTKCQVNSQACRPWLWSCPEWWSGYSELESHELVAAHFSPVRLGSNTFWLPKMLLASLQFILQMRRFASACRTGLIVGATR